MPGSQNVSVWFWLLTSKSDRKQHPAEVFALKHERGFYHSKTVPENHYDGDLRTYVRRMLSAARGEEDLPSPHQITVLPRVNWGDARS